MVDSPKIGVFLNDSPADKSVLAYTGKIARIRQAAEIHFTHYRETGPSDKRPDPEPEAFERRIREACPDISAERMICKVSSKKGLKAVLSSIRDNDFDLAIVGRRLPTDQLAAGPTVRRITAKAPCSVLVVTEYSYPHLERFLIPTDFSENSATAVAFALDMIRRSDVDNPQIVLQHNVEVGYGYHYAGVTFEEYAKSLEENAQREVEEFLGKLETGDLHVESIITCSASPDEAVAALAVARKMDVVIIGSRGAGSAFTALLGGTAERILMSCPLPVLVVKKKGETLKLLEAIMRE